MKGGRTNNGANQADHRAPERGLQPTSGSTGHRPVAPGNLPGATAAHSSAPTGRHSTAQGKALGYTSEIFSSPERAEPLRHVPSGLENFFMLPPRALPWAVESRAFSAGTSTPTALHLSAQGCRVRLATLDETSKTVSTLKGLKRFWRFHPG